MFGYLKNLLRKAMGVTSLTFSYQLAASAIPDHLKVSVTVVDPTKPWVAMSGHPGMLAQAVPLRPIPYEAYAMTDEVSTTTVGATTAAAIASVLPTENATSESVAREAPNIEKKAVAVEVSIVNDFDSVAARIKALHQKLGIELHSGWDEIVALAKKL
ncbi:hypothetical protein [Allorhizobium ampelinum]|uniref:hypothetical protein n=1 Tax=Allorhizobium ampelinum TaxID=3025782 RepID=UPI000B4058DE|nr:hypothetical protein [Allorhizobium ampelinum]NTA27415.1 hypothetical protein [Allorhizobium ampelinum]OVE94471.1 hypothetical protein B7W85_13040 [Allorhizobium ampelinum]